MGIGIRVEEYREIKQMVFRNEKDAAIPHDTNLMRSGKKVRIVRYDSGGKEKTAKSSRNVFVQYAGK